MLTFAKKLAVSYLNLSPGNKKNKTVMKRTKTKNDIAPGESVESVLKEEESLYGGKNL